MVRERDALADASRSDGINNDAYNTGEQVIDGPHLCQFRDGPDGYPIPDATPPPADAVGPSASRAPSWWARLLDDRTVRMGTVKVAAHMLTSDDAAVRGAAWEAVRLALYGVHRRHAWLDAQV